MNPFASGHRLLSGVLVARNRLLPLAAVLALWCCSGSRTETRGLTLHTPIRVCYLQDQLDYLLHTSCPDGSRPLTSRKAAHAARRGYVLSDKDGEVVDVYRLECPPHTHEIYLAMYHCGAVQDRPPPGGLKLPPLPATRPATKPTTRASRP